MEDTNHLPEHLRQIDLKIAFAAPSKSAFGYSTIGGNPICAPKESFSNPPKETLRSTRDANPFYDPRLTLQAAAAHIYKILNAALTACDNWLLLPTVSIQAEMEKDGEKNLFIRMCMDFQHIWFLLEHGRRGWDLTFLPENFFVDVEVVLDALFVKVKQISEIKGCGYMDNSGVVPLRSVKKRLDEIKCLRKSIWERTKATHEQSEQTEEELREAERNEVQKVSRSEGIAIVRRDECG